jgi:2-polyprenyl-3-methyl-5-hydroxy-6-metoxy-1,4-benzoquinol methylase
MFKYVGSPEDERREQHTAVALRMYQQWEATRGMSMVADNVRYHMQVISNAVDHFELIETTVSHVFRKRHKALGNRNYGEAFCDKLIDLGALRFGCKILEIGCGTGLFALSLLSRLKERHPSIYNSIHYTFFDLSPALQSLQIDVCQEHASRTSFVCGNIEEHDFDGARFDLIIANEMIADLTVGVAERKHLANGAFMCEAEEHVLNYKLDYSPGLPSFVVNCGAIKLLQMLPGWLSSGGIAVFTEYGSVDFFPKVVELAGHWEHSIHFGHLVRVAQQLSLNPKLEILGDFLGFDPDYEIIAGTSFCRLSYYLLPFLGKEPLPAMAYDREALHECLGAEMDNIGNLQFRPLREDAFMSPFAFYTLVLQV